MYRSGGKLGGSVSRAIIFYSAYVMMECDVIFCGVI